jgi:FAD/FMN-containing dehydrogenase
MQDNAVDLPVGPDGFYHPTTEAQICALIQRAKREGRKVRVRGSGHSVGAAILAGAPQAIDILLDQYAAVTIDRETKQATAQAGCHLGRDPFDSSGTSTVENSLFYQLDKAGLAISDVGGITHQTVGGFVSTGSSGGSLTHSFDDKIVSLRLIDGNGVVHDLSESSNRDLFHAASISMGLCGVISTVTIQCVDRFDVIGHEAITEVSACDVDLFGSGIDSLTHFLTQTPHARLLWWPQKGAEKMVVWQARHMRDRDYDDRTGPREDFCRKPYKEVTWVLGSPLPAEIVANLFYTLVGTWPDWLENLLGGGLKYKLLKGIVEGLFEPVILPALINAFVPADDEEEGPQEFWDSWWQGLPMDNQINDRVLPTVFTELWIPLERTEEVMKRLRDHYEDKGLSATGTFCCEIYAASKSRFWMSPAYGQDVIRIDLFWFEKNKANPATDYFPQFWELLKDFNYRLHWGKYLSGDVEYLKSNYPRWDDFMKVREAMDPDQIFVSDYWRKHLGIGPR